MTRMGRKRRLKMKTLVKKVDGMIQREDVVWFNYLANKWNIDGAIRICHPVHQPREEVCQ